MAERLKLHQELCELLGSKNVYFDPPENIKLKYPCFIYSKESPVTRSANNKMYFYMDSYNLIYIDANPDNDMTERVFSRFSYVRSGSSYVSDNLHHYTFDIYY